MLGLSLFSGQEQSLFLAVRTNDAITITAHTSTTMEDVHGLLLSLL
jgi:hypothetical protein